MNSVSDCFSTAKKSALAIIVLGAIICPSTLCKSEEVGPQPKAAEIRIATGQTIQPAVPNFPISPAQSTGAPPTPAPTPPVKTQTDVGPSQSQPSPDQSAGQTKIPNAVTVEYDTSLAPISNQKGVSVVQALNEALTNGPRAAAVRAQFAVTRATNYLTATQAPNPSFLFDRGMVAEQENRIGPVLMVEPPWKLFFRLLIAKRTVAQNKVDLLTTIWSLRHDVRSAYVEVVVAQETQKTLVDLRDLAARLLLVSEKRFHAGDVPELDVLKARLATAQAQVAVAVGSKRVIRAKQQLNILMGHPVDAPLSVPDLPDYTGSEPTAKLRLQKSDILPDFTRDIAPLDVFIDKALQSRLELKSLGIQVKLNRANAQGNYGNIIPNCSFAYGKSTAGNPTPGPKLTAVFMTLNQEFPFTNFQQGGIYQFKATGKQLGYQIDSQRNQVMTDVSNAYNTLLGARERIRVYQDRLLKDSNEVARLARRSYEVGQSDVTASLFAQQLNIQTRGAYLDGVSSYASAFTDLEFAVGKPLQ
jgi:cobalt-zinc-cadmium efflux system outer membrane protein